MLQEFLRHGKRHGQTNLVPISGRVPVLNLEFAHFRSGVQPTVENLPKDCHGSAGFCGVCGGLFAVDIFGRKMQKKNRRKIRQKIRQPKTKNLPAHDPPKAASQAQKSAAKPTNKSVCQTSKYTPGFCR